MSVYPGPTANLPGRARRSGRSGTVWIDGRMYGEVVALDWSREAEQVAVPVSGRWQDETKPGAETARGTFRYQDLHDKWRLFVWRFFKARRANDRAAAAFPEFDIITKIDDIGAPMATRWLLQGCQLFQYDGGFDINDDLLVRDVPFTFREDKPLEAWEYGDSGIIVTSA